MIKLMKESDHTRLQLYKQQVSEYDNKVKFHLWNGDVYKRKMKKLSKNSTYNSYLSFAEAMESLFDYVQQSNEYSWKVTEIVFLLLRDILFYDLI